MDLSTIKDLNSEAMETLKILQQGNLRFQENKLNSHNYSEMRTATVDSQSPHTIIVACSDSRVPPEYIFDSGLGSVFIVRTAGNVIDPVALGSIEYAAKHLGSKIIMVMGHNNCGAVKAAFSKKPESDNLKQTLEKIYPAVDYAISLKVEESEMEQTAVEKNVANQIEYAINNSTIIKTLMDQKKITLIGANYDLESGKVTLLA